MKVSNLLYITDNQGIKSCVIIPVNEWQRLNTELDNLKKELSAIHRFQKELSVLSEKELIDRALLSEAQISSKQFSTIEEFELETHNW